MTRKCVVVFHIAQLKGSAWALVSAEIYTPVRVFSCGLELLQETLLEWFILFFSLCFVMKKEILSIISVSELFIAKQ